MNPFTRFLAGRSSDRRLKQFIERWDSLEALIIRVYRAREATPADEAEYATLKDWLEINYPDWRPGLTPHWQAAQAAGEPVKDDPFMTLIAPQQAQAFVGNWPAMQRLPAAREALNRYIMATTGQ